MNEKQYIYLFEGKWSGMKQYATFAYAESIEAIKAYEEIWRPGLKWFKNHSYEMARYKDEGGIVHTYRISRHSLLVMQEVITILERKQQRKDQDLENAS